MFAVIYIDFVCPKRKKKKSTGSSVSRFRTCALKKKQNIVRHCHSNLSRFFICSAMLSIRRSCRVDLSQINLLSS